MLVTGAARQASSAVGQGRLAVGQDSASRAVPLWAIISAALAPVLMTVSWLISDWLQPASYNPVRQSISVMAGYAGTDRWIMTGATFLVGCCYLLIAAGLADIRAVARIPLIVAGMAAIGIAASPEPASGSTPQHLAWTALGEVAIAIWPAFLARRTAPQPLILRRWGTAAMTAVFLGLLGWLVVQTQGGADLGLAERLSVSVQTSWPLVVALAMWRATRREWAGEQRVSSEPGTGGVMAMAGAASVARPPRDGYHGEQRGQRSYQRDEVSRGEIAQGDERSGETDNQHGRG